VKNKIIAVCLLSLLLLSSSSNFIVVNVISPPPLLGTIVAHCDTCNPLAIIVAQYRLENGNHDIYYIRIGSYAGNGNYSTELKIIQSEWNMLSINGCLTIYDIEATILPPEGDGENTYITLPSFLVCEPRMLFLPVTIR
jgi:hypothetical protein